MCVCVCVCVGGKGGVRVGTVAGLVHWRSGKQVGR